MAPGYIWSGSVDGKDYTYTVLTLESDDPTRARAWVSRRGVRGGFCMTNVERAKHLAEMQETMDPLRLHEHGLLLK